MKSDLIRPEFFNHFNTIDNAGKLPPRRNRLDTKKSTILQQLKKIYLGNHMKIEVNTKNIKDEYDFLSSNATLELESSIRNSNFSEF